MTEMYRFSFIQALDDLLHLIFFTFKLIADSSKAMPFCSVATDSTSYI